MRKLKMPKQQLNNFEDVFHIFEASQNAKGVSETTLNNYKYNLKNISKYLDVRKPFEDVTKRDIEKMVAAMREAGFAHNSIATYVRNLKTFYNWCKAEGFSSIDFPSIRERETVKETYTDAELERLLRRPTGDCDFGEYRSWVLVNFFMNSGCRSATVRHIQNKDVDFGSMTVVFRHNKNGRIQTIPLCSLMASILKEYMKIRGGAADAYLFCNTYGEMLTEDALRHAIRRYNQSRGVESTSIHKFRHTFARKYLIDCGGNAFTLQKLMGHSTLNMTKHYCRVFDTDIAKDYDILSPLAQFQKGRVRITKR